MNLETHATGVAVCAVFRFESPAVDVCNRALVAERLRNDCPPDRPLILDWSEVSYVDVFGLETVFDAIMERKAPVAFVGLSHDLRHYLHRLQLTAVLPIGESIDDARRLLGVEP